MRAWTFWLSVIFSLTPASMTFHFRPTGKPRIISISSSNVPFVFICLHTRFTGSRIVHTVVRWVSPNLGPHYRENIRELRYMNLSYCCQNFCEGFPLIFIFLQIRLGLFFLLLHFSPVLVLLLSSQTSRAMPEFFPSCFPKNLLAVGDDGLCNQKFRERLSLFLFSCK